MDGKWATPIRGGEAPGERGALEADSAICAMRIQNGKQGDVKNLAEANAQAAVESAATGGTH